MRRFNALEEWEQTLILSSIQRISAMMNTAELPSEAYDIDPEI